MPVPLPQISNFEVDALGGACVRPWEEYNAATLIELSCQVPAGRTFRASLVNLALDQVHLAHVRGTAHLVRRDRPMVADRPTGAIGVYAALRGEVRTESGSLRTVIRPGQALVCDVDSPFRREFGCGLEEFVVKVPRAALTTIAGMREFGPLVLDTAADPHARALVRLVGRAVGSPVPVPADDQTVLELVAVIVGGGRVRLPLAHRAAARAFIEDNLADPYLSAADVAAGIGISERQLSRIFAELGTSVPRHVLARRLDRARSMLIHAGSDRRTVDIAAQCGFTSMPYFSTAFKRRFGVAAGEVRRASR
ncbi:helix-turn-helix domain-containing protein [Nocardia macrotermitis]|uniref:HTH-type transcriptional activator RhaS n=1 Tax=Nocardia macrotermitis TaxID=2585198 RepID=A0A7K0D4Q4_9NOCA|nr:AraC family transcriptional regulator [Nocardia macrotermitis]MQY20312.1 HTH-type transcriptional activator RhaS [Nocardia macrotermitis]